VRAVRALTIVDAKLVVAERPTPKLQPGEQLVRVHGAGVNRADLAQRAGGYPAPPGVPADIPGLEFAGTVEATGERVFGIAGGGAQAEMIAVPVEQCVPIPDGLDVLAMGGVPEAFVTAHDALVTQARVQPGEWVLIHAVGSGVGTAGLQLAKALGANVIGTSRTHSKLDRCQALGLDVGIVPPTTDGRVDVDALAWQIIEATGSGANVTLDLVGGDNVTADVNAAAPQARIVCIGTVAGGTARLPIFGLMSKRLQLFGTVLRARTVAEKAEAMQGFARDVVPLLASNRVEPIIDTVIPLAEGERGYDLVASDATFGKVLLDCRSA
jgi:NADPH:quinone reductase-like Zn-dependent oxidoreductase